MADRQITFWNTTNRSKSMSGPRSGSAPPYRPDGPPGASAEALDGDRLAGTGRLREWLPLSMTSGFIATGVVTCALLVTGGWMYLLGETPLAGIRPGDLALALLLHVAAGLVWSGLYAVFFEPAMTGPGWRKGAIFSLILWAMSLSVLLPGSQVDAAALGFSAGLFPVAASLVLNLIYGSVLGQVYASNRVLTESGRPQSAAEDRALARAQRAMAAGLLPGAVTGLVLGVVAAHIVAPAFDPAIVGVVSMVLGACGGLVVGSFSGLSPRRPANPGHQR